MISASAKVCSVAMFNMNPRVSDSPVDAPKDFAYYMLCKLSFNTSGIIKLSMQSTNTIMYYTIM